MNAADSGKAYLPAAGHDWLLPLYDPFVKLVGGEAARRTLLDQATIQPSFRVLDIGCGTGTFAILIKKLHPAVDVVGLDPDPKVLARGKGKAERAGISIRLDQGFAEELPYKNGSFDQVFSTLMFHHVPLDKKEKALSEVRRVLRAGGSFHMLDFAGSEGADYGLLPRLFHSSHHLKDNSEERILTLMNRVGFISCQKVMEGAMLFGSLRLKYYRAGVNLTLLGPTPLGGPGGNAFEPKV
jgi:ubiquinone/menaquinone biosynthesis C-methylase UbiE